MSILFVVGLSRSSSCILLKYIHTYIIIAKVLRDLKRMREQNFCENSDQQVAYIFAFVKKKLVVNIWISEGKPRSITKKLIGRWKDNVYHARSQKLNGNLSSES